MVPNFKYKWNSCKHSNRVYNMHVSDIWQILCNLQTPDTSPGSRNVDFGTTNQPVIYFCHTTAICLGCWGGTLWSKGHLMKPNYWPSLSWQSHNAPIQLPTPPELTHQLTEGKSSQPIRDVLEMRCVPQSASVSRLIVNTRAGYNVYTQFII